MSTLWKMLVGTYHFIPQRSSKHEDRGWTRGSAEARSIACGANFSPAEFVGRTNKPVTCIWGCGELGTWNHCAWECSQRPQSPVVPPPRPPAELTARFGWVMEGQYDANQIHAWLIIVQARIWQIHHGDLTE